jgi:predicted negative regulator of RcsB-dependent stress response
MASNDFMLGCLVIWTITGTILSFVGVFGYAYWRSKKYPDEWEH